MSGTAASFVRDAFDLVDRLDRLDTIAALRVQLTQFFAQCGIEHYVVCRVPPPGQDRLAPLFLVDNWPREWLDYYDRNKFVRHDPITARLLSSYDPFLWSEVPIDRRDEPTAYRIMSEATDAGMVEGLSIPIFDPIGFQGCISMSGRKLEIDAERKRALHLVSLFAHGAAERLHRVENSASVDPLSEREREVLRWLATGRTQDEIADALGISQRTVETHLKNARRKLRTTNTLHTAVVALQRGEIRL